MATYDRQQQYIQQLEQEAAQLRHELEDARKERRDDFSRTLADRVYKLVLFALVLIGAAIGMRFFLEYHRPQIRSDISVADDNKNAFDWGSAPPLSRAPTPVDEPVSSPDPYPEARQTLVDHIDRAEPTKGGGNSYSISLSDLDKVIDTLKDTAKLPAETALKLTEELAKNAISTGSEILKDTAKAIIARYLGPPKEDGSSGPAKSASTAPAQLVQVNVYPSERQIVTSAPKKPAAPAKSKPKPPCPSQAIPNTAPACHIDPARQSG